MSRARLKIFFDGGCRPNPGRMEAAVVARGVVHVFEDFGFGTSEGAEWLALMQAVELTRSLGLAEVELVGDARHVVDQANAVLRSGCAASGPALAFLAAAENIAAHLRVRWIKRSQNLAGIALAARHPR